MASTASPARFVAVAVLAAVANAAHPGPAMAQPVVQALPDPAAIRLNDALRRLAQDPRSLTALIDAGNASVALDDIDAAQGFFGRAEAIAPADGRVKAGLAAVMVRRQQPVEALRLFAEAEQAGEPMRFHAAERGLAYDLIGDNARAQAEYYVFLSLAEDPLVTRRLALSQAIAVDQRASDATLLPLLQRTDLAAYRTRAFALAILGRTDEAVSIAETMLPERVSSRMAPYLRYMPRLTRAQQAAAANLGLFPQAAQIGRDDPALAAYATQTGARPPAQTADARLVPAGEPLGSVRRREDVQAAPPPSDPERVFAQAPAPLDVAGASEAPVVVAQVEPAPEPEPPLAEPEIDLAQAPADDAPPGDAVVVLAQTESGAPPPAAPEPEPQVTLVEAFADFSLPAGSAAPTTPAAGAVDITTIRPRREVQAPPARPAPPPVPSRHWVQVATGRDTNALAFDWRRIKREAAGLLDRPGPHTARWGQTNRLVVGPFASAREADAMVARLKDKQLDSFRFTSAQGEEVKPLG